MAFVTLIHAAKQVRQGTISYDLLDSALQAEIDQVDVNKTDIAAIIASKGQANGIATLGADGTLVSSQIPAIAVSDFLGEVASEAALTGLTGQRGDWATVVPADASQSQSYMLIGDDATVAANWKEIKTPQGGVTSLRNVSGTVTGQNGVVTLADVAFSGQSVDIAFSHASYTATDVSAALIEVMGKVGDNTQDITNLTNIVNGKLDVSKIKTAVDLTGTIDGTNKTFAVPEAFAAGTLEVFFNGVYIKPGTDYTLSGQNVTLIASPDYPEERPFVNYIVS